MYGSDPPPAAKCFTAACHSFSTEFAFSANHTTMFSSVGSGESLGREFRGSGTPHIRPRAYLRLRFLHQRDRISLFNWLIFFMKCALHFSTKLNFRDVQKCNCFWVPSYDLFASACQAVFPAPTATGVHRLTSTWSSL